MDDSSWITQGILFVMNNYYNFQHPQEKNNIHPIMIDGDSMSNYDVPATPEAVI